MPPQHQEKGEPGRGRGTQSRWERGLGSGGPAATAFLGSEGSLSLALGLLPLGGEEAAVAPVMGMVHPSDGDNGWARARGRAQETGPGPGLPGRKWGIVSGPPGPAGARTMQGAWVPAPPPPRGTCLLLPRPHGASTWKRSR